MEIKAAFNREQQIKKWSRTKKIVLAEQNTEELQLLAEFRNNSHFQNKD
jgi:predicted GIY-YIG superfamily endonuclease